MPNYQTYFWWALHCVIIIVLISQKRPCQCKESFSEELDVLLPLYVRRTYLENQQIHFRNQNYTGFVDPGIVNINKAFEGSTEILHEMIVHKVIEWILLLGKSPLPHKMQKNNVFFVINRGRADDLSLFKSRLYWCGINFISFNFHFVVS